MAVTRETTIEQLWALPDDGMRREVVDGELHVMPPAGGEHGVVALAVGHLLRAHVRGNDLGLAFAAETGFVLAHDPDTVRAPDAAFVNKERVAVAGPPRQFWPGAPDFAAEVVSPSDTAPAVRETARAWLEAGTKLVLVLDPADRSATVYRSGREPHVHADGDVVDLDHAVPGWHVAVSDLFD